MKPEEKMTQEQTITRIMSINDRLKQKGFDWSEIDLFWARIFRLGKQMKAAGLDLDDIKICTECGHLDIEEIKPPALACCPTAKYVPVVPGQNLKK